VKEIFFAIQDGECNSPVWSFDYDDSNGAVFILSDSIIERLKAVSKFV
jgi:hypothetical protein